ncbi:flavin-binding monooxygenase [Biscogniauxia mediterranea]|nr:flavin-binding monooxygenase [Biscogniauxia mediterranea]
MGSTNGTTPFTIKDAPIDGHRPMKVRIIGAGYSGIYLGIRIPQRLRNIDLKIYEQHEAVGGTWWVNRYPGCACDVPAHSYQYSFNPNPNWSAFYAPQSEICAYLQDTAEKFGVMRFVKTSHKVEECRWDDDLKKWILTVQNLATKETFQDETDVLVSARGNLSDPAWPDIPGLKGFRGELMHSARWNESYDFKNKHVGVIGNGSSAIQIVPKLQKIEGIRISCFVRSKTWITNPFGDIVMTKLGLDPKKLDFTPEQRREFAANPSKLHRFRRAIEVDGNAAHAVSLRDSTAQRTAIDIFRAEMRKRLANKPEIADFLLPSFGVGCRRATPGPGYLEALVEPNVDFITDPIAEITPTGVTLGGDRGVALDALVCATGFNTASAPPFGVRGRGGVTLAERFGHEGAGTGAPEAYLSMAVDPFPNFFMMLGPNSAIGSGSLTVILEAEGDYVVRCVRKMQKEDYAAMCVRPERVRDWRDYCREYFKKTVYSDTCHSWYKSGPDNRVTGLWPGSTMHALEALRAPRWEDYEWEGLPGAGGNMLRWLGNGWSVTHMEREDGEEETNGEKDAADIGRFLGDPAWYIEPAFVNVPLPGRPEDDPEFRRRPFSH